MSDIEPDPPDITEDFLGDVSTNGASTREAPFVLEGEPYIDESPPFEEATTLIGDGSCIVCGAPTFRPPGLTPTGRKKRIPKYCDLHAPNVRVSSERPSFAGLESQLQRIQDELADDIRLLGTLAGPLFPTTGYYLYERADPFTIAVLKLCKNNQRMLRVLHRAAQVAPVYTIAESAAGVAYAVQVDQKRADPHNNIARRLGVERAYNAVYPQNNGRQEPVFQAPPHYANAR